MTKHTAPRIEVDRFVLNEFLEKQSPSHEDVVRAIKAIIRVIALLIMGQHPESRDGQVNGKDS